MELPDFLERISKGLKTPITEAEILGKEIEINYLKRIDNIFEKGLHYYLDPAQPITSKDSSIFFRKQSFQNDQLSLGAIHTVHEFEEMKHLLSGYNKLAGTKYDRQIPTYTILDPPQRVAKEIRKILYPAFSSNRRNFLKSIIHALATQNIMVFEFVETWNKKEKANIDGFYLKPNIIVLKRYGTFTREFFTLAHEIGHYLLNKEEIDTITYDFIENKNLSKVEKWCNDFAFFFLAGDYAVELTSLETASSANDYHHDIIGRISDNTHLSRLALYTRLLLQNQISPKDYKVVRDGFEEEYRVRKEERENEKQRKKELGIPQPGGTPKPIKSPLFISIVRSAFYEGVLDEYEAGKILNVKSEKLNEYL